MKDERRRREEEAERRGEVEGWGVGSGELESLRREIVEGVVEGEGERGVGQVAGR